MDERELFSALLRYTVEFGYKGHRLEVSSSIRSPFCWSAQTALSTVAIFCLYENSDIRSSPIRSPLTKPPGVTLFVGEFYKFVNLFQMFNLIFYVESTTAE